MHWSGFPILVVPNMAWETISICWVSCCRVDPRLGLVLAICGMAPLTPPPPTGNRLSFSAECPVPKHPGLVICCTPEKVPEARLTSFSIIVGVAHFIPSARLMDEVAWGFDFGK